MRIPTDAIIADEKLTAYLLVPRFWDDKSGYLRGAGFSLDHWTKLRDEIRRIAATTEAVEDGGNEYGIFYHIESVLNGPAAKRPVTLIWMRRAVDQEFHFITLKPRKE
jgi:hypothetical protein